MSKEKKDTVEETDVEATETEAEETEESETEETDEAEAGDKNTDKAKEEDVDLQAEIDAEKKRGKPDPTIAAEAFKGRKQKREDGAEDQEDEDEKPLTRRDIAEIEARTERKILAGNALAAAKALTENPKEAELVVARWNNRTFPEGTPLSEQIEEVYTGLPHVRKRLIGERNEALRALKGRHGTNRNPADSHREPAAGAEPKMPAQDAQAIKAAGFAFNGTSRRWEKKLSNGDMLVKDPKTKVVSIVKSKKA